MFLRIIHEWWNLKLLKRGGHAHDPSGVSSTKPGELALICPACPDPNINLPADWEKHPHELQCVNSGQYLQILSTYYNIRYLYTYFQANDANFQLKNCLNGIIDVDLGTGWSYFVKNGPYKQFLMQQHTQSEVHPSLYISF